MIYRGTYQDCEAKAKALAVCTKRNMVISQYHPKRWKPIYEPTLGGWRPALRPISA